MDNSTEQPIAPKSTPIIACATRGGQGSRAAQFAAVERAKQDNAKLYFIYVVDESAITGIDSTIRKAVKGEMFWLARTMLTLAIRRALSMGVAAEMAVLHGNLQEQLVAWLRNVKPQAFVLGAPRGTTDIFGDDEVERFALSIEQETGVDVMLIRPEDYPEIVAEVGL